MEGPRGRGSVPGEEAVTYNIGLECTAREIPKLAQNWADALTLDRKPPGVLP